MAEVIVEKVVKKSGRKGKKLRKTAKKLLASEFANLSIVKPDFNNKQQQRKYLKDEVKLAISKVMSMPGIAAKLSQLPADMQIRVMECLCCSMLPEVYVIDRGIDFRLMDGAEGATASAVSFLTGLINVVWVANSVNSGKFSLLVEPHMGSMTNFVWSKIFLMGPNGFPTDPEDSFADPKWYSSTATSGQNGNVQYPLLFDINYPALTQAVADNAVANAASAGAGYDTTPMANMSCLAPLGFGTPNPGTTTYYNEIFGRLGDQIFIKTDTVSSETTVILPPGIWKMTWVSMRNSAAAITGYVQHVIAPVNNSCTVFNAAYRWTSGGNLVTAPGMASVPPAPGTFTLYNCEVFVSSVGNSRCIFNIFINKTSDQVIDSTTIYFDRWVGVDGSSLYTLGTGSQNFNILTTNGTTNSQGIATRVRTSGMTVKVSNALSSFNASGKMVGSLLTRGLAESNFKQDASAPPGQLQDFANLNTVKSEKLMNPWEEGIHCFWKITDKIADTKFRDIVNTQAILDADEEQPSAICVSGVCPPPPTFTVVGTQIVSVATFEVITMYELLVNGQLIPTYENPGSSDAFDVFVEIMNSVPAVHGNKNHGSTLSDKLKSIAQSIRDAYNVANNFSMSSTGKPLHQHAIEVAERMAAELAAESAAAAV